MKKIYIVFSLLVFGMGAIAQQLPHYSQYLLNDYAINPAVGGSKDYFAATSNNRYQWVGITDAPRTYILSLHGPLKNRKMGVGGMLYTDIAGAQRRTGAGVSYSYHLQLNDDLNLSFGVMGGVLQYATDFAKVKFNDLNDPAATTSLASVIVPDFSAGLYLYSDRAFVSFSAPQLVPFKVQYFDDFEETQGKLVNHFYLSAGYKLPIGETFAIEPSALLKYVSPVPPQFEATLRAFYKNAVWVGGSYRMQDAIAIMAGYLFQENLMIGYSFDLITSDLQNYSSGTHELKIGIRFKNRGTSSPSVSKIE